MTNGAWLSPIKAKHRDRERTMVRNVGVRHSCFVCVVCVALLRLKGIAVEKRKFVVLVAHTSLGQLVLNVLGVSGHLNW